MGRINWAIPLVTVIQEEEEPTPKPDLSPPENKSILKSRTQPFPFVDEIPQTSSSSPSSATLHLQHHGFTSSSATSATKETNKAWSIILIVLKILFANKALSYFTNLLVTFIGLISIGMLRVIVSVGKLLLKLDYSVFIEFFLLLNPTYDHLAMTTGTTNIFSKRRQ